jgi:hypothetical protein
MNLNRDQFLDRCAVALILVSGAWLVWLLFATALLP